MKKIIILIIAAVAALSCEKDNTLRYNNLTMGNIVDGKFVSDQGNTFNVVEQTCPGKLDTMKRAIILCDVLYQEEGGDYAIRLNNMLKVLTKSPVNSSEATDESLLVDDALILSELWISGGYMNMMITIPVKQNSKQPHMINLILDDSVQEAGTYSFSLRHNAVGEVLKTDGDNKDMYLANAYVSFPITDIITEDSAKINLSLKSYKVLSGYIISSETFTDTIEINYTKGAFEQAPVSKSSTSSDFSLN